MIRTPWLCAAIAVFAVTNTSAQQTDAAAWSIEGGGYTVEVAEPAISTGASLVLRSATDDSSMTGRVATSVPAASVIMRRIFIRGEVQTRDAPDGAALWLRVERTGSPITDYGFDGRLQGGSDWTARSVSLPVPSDATRISYGVRLWGRGAVSARHLRMEVGAVLSPDAPLEASAAAVLQSALDIVKKNGLRRERVSWPVLEREVRTLASGATRTSDVYAAIGHLLAEATDPNDSSLRSPAQWAAMMNAGAETPLPVARVVDQAAGYIELPGHNTDDIRRNREYARRAHQLIEQIMPVAPCAWIVDVRRNGGGNVYPMLAALKPFLGDEALGSNVGPDGPESPRVAGQNSDVVPPPALASLETASVAVLVGPGTGSSGERVAISFRGRARTRLFGQPTRGATTANETFVLPDGARLVVTQSVMADRTGRTYGGRVEPDDVVSISLPGASATRSGDDPVLRAAVQWLRQGSGCLTQ